MRIKPGYGVWIVGRHLLVILYSTRRLFPKSISFKIVNDFQSSEWKALRREFCKDFHLFFDRDGHNAAYFLCDYGHDWRESTPDPSPTCTACSTPSIEMPAHIINNDQDRAISAQEAGTMSSNPVNDGQDQSIANQRNITASTVAAENQSTTAPQTSGVEGQLNSLSELNHLTEDLLAKHNAQQAGTDDSSTIDLHQLGSEIAKPVASNSIAPSSVSGPAFPPQSAATSVTEVQQRFVPDVIDLRSVFSDLIGGPGEGVHQPKAPAPQVINQPHQPAPLAPAVQTGSYQLGPEMANMTIELESGYATSQYSHPAPSTVHIPLPSPHSPLTVEGQEALANLSGAFEDFKTALATGNLQNWDKALVLGQLGRRNLEQSVDQHGKLGRIQTNEISIQAGLIWEGQAWNPDRFKLGNMNNRNSPSTPVVGQKRKHSSVVTDAEVEAGLNLWRGMSLVNKMARKAVKDEKEFQETSGSS